MLRVIGFVLSALCLVGCGPAGWSDDHWTKVLGQQRSLADINASFCGNEFSHSCSAQETRAQRSRGQLGDPWAFNRLTRKQQRNLTLCLKRCAQYDAISIIVEFPDDPDLEAAVNAKAIETLGLLGASAVRQEACTWGCLYIAMRGYWDFEAPLERDMAVAPRLFLRPRLYDKAVPAIDNDHVLSVGLGSSLNTSTFAWKSSGAEGASCMFGNIMDRERLLRAVEICVLAVTVAPCSIECLSPSVDVEARQFLRRKFKL